MDKIPEQIKGLDMDGHSEDWKVRAVTHMNMEELNHWMDNIVHKGGAGNNEPAFRTKREKNTWWTVL